LAAVSAIKWSHDKDYANKQEFVKLGYSVKCQVSTRRI